MRIPTRHGHASYKILFIGLFGLTLLFSLNTQALSLGNTLADFTLPDADVGYGQRLSEQRGKPVMLIILGRCSDCTDSLQELEDLAKAQAKEGLVSWVIWTPQADDVAPKLSLPVLKADATFTASLLGSNQAPAILLINQDGALNALLLGSLSTLHKKAQQQLITWMPSQHSIAGH